MSKDHIGISIVVPVYNSEKFIANGIESILKQTYKNFEIICVNDGSTDNSEEIIEQYVKKYPQKIKLINQKNQGTGFARNTGIDNTSGEYIGFLDSDDTLDPKMFEKLYKNAKRYNSDIVVGGIERIDEDTNKVLCKDMVNHKYKCLEVQKENINELLFINPGPCNKIHKREIFDKVRFSKIPVVDDLCLMIGYFPTISRVSYVPEVIYNYRIRRASLSNSLEYSTFKELKDVMLNLKINYRKKEVPEYFMEYLDKMAFIHIGISLLTKLSYRKDVDMRKEIKETKLYLDQNFKNWRNFSLIEAIKSKNLRYIGLYFLSCLYKLNLFIVFIIFYKFINNTLKKDIKW